MIMLIFGVSILLARTTFRTVVVAGPWSLCWRFTGRVVFFVMGVWSGCIVGRHLEGSQLSNIHVSRNEYLTIKLLCVI